MAADGSAIDADLLPFRKLSRVLLELPDAE